MKQQKTEPIRIGDRFKGGGGVVWTVTNTYPGGHIDLIDSTKTRLMPTYHRLVKTWERVQ